MTPTTLEVRESYTYFRGTIPTVEHEAEFDRWLNEVKAEAWTNGYERGYDDGDDKRDYDPTQHPYIEKDEV